MKTLAPSLRTPAADHARGISLPKLAPGRNAPASRPAARGSSKHFLKGVILSGQPRGRGGESGVRCANAARIAEFLLSRSIFILAVFLCPSATAFCLAFALLASPAQADTFGEDLNRFTIGFVPVGHAGNAADTNGYGAVPYEYRMSIQEISQDQIGMATAAGLADVTAGAWQAGQPAANISWYEAAAFVNWMNTSTGSQAAYNLTFNGRAWSMDLWSGEEAWTAGGTNLYRHKDATYFLPSENEWYKAAYFNAAGADYFLYPTESSTAPVAVVGGTGPNTAVYDKAADVPAAVDVAGALSAYGTMAQGGNVWEWTETAAGGANIKASEPRVVRGGSWADAEGVLRSSFRSQEKPSLDDRAYGFRVASIPEPSTYALLFAGAAAMFLWTRRACFRRFSAAMQPTGHGSVTPPGKKLLRYSRKGRGRQDSLSRPVPAQRRA